MSKGYQGLPTGDLIREDEPVQPGTLRHRTSRITVSAAVRSTGISRARLAASAATRLAGCRTNSAASRVKCTSRRSLRTACSALFQVASMWLGASLLTGQRVRVG